LKLFFCFTLWFVQKHKHEKLHIITNSKKKIPVQYSSKQISFYEQQKLKLNVYVFIHFKQTTNQNKIHIKKIKTKIK
jgi:hypothetical protein